MNTRSTSKPDPRKTDEKRGTPVAILVRVSTAKQETDRQVSELEAYAKDKGYRVVEVCRECVSGGAAESEREGLKRVLELARAGGIKKVLVHEVSRLARRNSVAHCFLEELDECCVSLYWHQQAIETLLPNGKRNPAAGIMFALLAEMARAERETLRSRIKSGLEEAARKGRFPGRPLGSRKSDDEVLKQYAPVVRQLRAGQSIRNAAAICGVSKNTVQKVRAVAVVGRCWADLK
jgi:DNA invertase Pin-like site-specific DNA recombinase